MWTTYPLWICPQHPLHLRANVIAGVIASVREGARESDIDEVKNLVRNVIGRPSCLILLVITCDSRSLLPLSNPLLRGID